MSEGIFGLWSFICHCTHLTVPKTNYIDLWYMVFLSTLANPLQAILEFKESMFCSFSLFESG
jgi:hypothetical protein